MGLSVKSMIFIIIGNISDKYINIRKNNNRIIK